jgi:hypothetical protein
MKDKLSLIVELKPGSLAGRVLLRNQSKAEVKLWSTGNRWGDYALRFQIDSTGGSIICEKQQQIYTRNVPTYASISPGKDYVISFDLNDGSWSCGSLLAKNITRLTAIYEIRPTPESEKHNVLSGSISGLVSAA